MARRTSKLARSESRGKYDLSLKLQCSAIQLLEESVLCLLINSEFEHALESWQPKCVDCQGRSIDGYHRTNVFWLCLKLYVRTFTDNLSRHIVGKTVGCIK